MIARTSVSEERIQPRTYARPSTVTSCLSSSIYPDLHAFSPLLAIIYTHLAPSMVPTQYIPLKSLIPLPSPITFT